MQFPPRFADDPDAVFAFCRDIADATAEFACAFKPQIAHFAACGAEDALVRLIAHIHAAHPGIPVILDAKRGRSEEHTSELQSLMRISYAVFCLKKKKNH